VAQVLVLQIRVIEEVLHHSVRLKDHLVVEVLVP
jgi:hypothetical protein